MAMVDATTTTATATFVVVSIYRVYYLVRRTTDTMPHSHLHPKVTLFPTTPFDNDCGWVPFCLVLVVGVSTICGVLGR